MNSRAVSYHGLKIVLGAGFVLTAAHFAASMLNFGLQIVLGRYFLSLGEFGAFNSAAALVGLAVVPVTAAAQAVTHYLARHHAFAETEKLEGMQEASYRLLQKITWITLALALVATKPLSDFFHFPRPTLALMALLCIPVMLWAQLGTVWCSGLSKFGLLAVLVLTTAVVRLASAAGVAWIWPTAEAALCSTFVSGLVLAGVVPFSRRKRTGAAPLESPWNQSFFVFLAAALCVGIANYVFLWADQLFIGRIASGDLLGAYTTAGLLGRAVVWGPLPLLIVYFTQRSSTERSNHAALVLVAVYFTALLGAALVVGSFDRFFCKVLLGREEETAIGFISQFAKAMVPLGILQAVGLYCLAARRLKACFGFGVLGLGYVAVLGICGRQPELLLTYMFGGACVCLLVLGCALLVQWGRRQP